MRLVLLLPLLEFLSLLGMAASFGFWATIQYLALALSLGFLFFLLAGVSKSPGWKMRWVLAGLLLILPGPLTDGIALLLISPLGSWLLSRSQFQVVRFGGFQRGGPAAGSWAGRRPEQRSDRGHPEDWRQEAGEHRDPQPRIIDTHKV